MIAIYNQMLQRKFTDKMDEDVEQYFAYTIDGARRARMLVDDLLAYTRVAVRGIDVPERTSAAEALDEALKNLAIAIRDSGASIVYGALPAVLIHPVHLRQLFQNLVGNALKYRSHIAPRIEIGAVKRGDEWEFSVKDNGIGISPEYHEQIFDIFKRLHPASEYDGTGIGLALCRRIVERYGGRIWVESAAGEGATFLFTLGATGQTNSA
jgi:light-regulated signal transduction histidine kinase (bacteriophytochrome)